MSLGQSLPLIPHILHDACVLSLTVFVQILRYGLTHEEVQWDKKKKAASVAKWYEDKYPGTQSSCVTGVRH